MTGYEFKLARIKRLKVSQAELALLMQTPKRTLQDIEAQHDDQIRGVYAVCIELLIQRDKWATEAVIARVTADIASNHPNGIQSVVDRSFNED